MQLCTITSHIHVLHKKCCRIPISRAKDLLERPEVSTWYFAHRESHKIPLPRTCASSPRSVVPASPFVRPENEPQHGLIQRPGSCIMHWVRLTVWLCYVGRFRGWIEVTSHASVRMTGGLRGTRMATPDVFCSDDQEISEELDFEFEHLEVH